MTIRDSLPELTRLQQERVACAFLSEGCMLETVPSSSSFFLLSTVQNKILYIVYSLPGFVCINYTAYLFDPTFTVH